MNKSHPIRVITWEGANAVSESRKQIDHADSSDRKWLANHIFWAMRNNRRIEITPESI